MHSCTIRPCGVEVSRIYFQYRYINVWIFVFIVRFGHIAPVELYAKGCVSSQNKNIAFFDIFSCKRVWEDK